ncbi:sensor histidine kinase [Streptomyces sp. NPDC020965]|uniref:sensor histidine kinase n=1 Tax=Streptomyces sp. NPDC020965 TaxID=3365105 RepID=UPI0037B44313
MPVPAPSPRLRQAAGTALAWCGAIVYPAALVTAVRSGPGGSGELLEFTLAATATILPAGLLRRSPLSALTLMLLGTFAAATTRPNDEIAYLLVLINDIVVGGIVAHRRRAEAVTAAVLTLATQISAVGYLRTGSSVFTNSVTGIVLALVAAWVIGSSVRERREHAEALRTQSAARAVAAERLRIARELHDMIAHSIGVIAIQAGVGRRVIDTQPDEARNALATIEVTSRETLAGLRRTLGALRRSAPEAGAAAPLDPTPGLADLGRLTDATHDAGVRVEVRWRGERRPLPPDIDLAAFRIVQESLTNVVRHARTRDARVGVDYGDGVLTVEIDDDGRGAAGPGTGYGIVGMRERAALLGGELTAGPRAGGGFRVTARLPLPGEPRETGVRTSGERGAG